MVRLRLTSVYLAGPIFCPDPDRMGHVDIAEKRDRFIFEVWFCEDFEK